MIRIDVLESDIIGSGKTIFDNPITKAIRRYLKEEIQPVSTSWAYLVFLDEDDYLVQIELPQIIDTVYKLPVVLPFSFMVDIPEKYLIGEERTC